MLPLRLVITCISIAYYLCGKNIFVSSDVIDDVCKDIISSLPPSIKTIAPVITSTSSSSSFSSSSSSSSSSLTSSFPSSSSSSPSSSSSSSSSPITSSTSSSPSSSSSSSSSPITSSTSSVTVSSPSSSTSTVASTSSATSQTSPSSFTPPTTFASSTTDSTTTSTIITTFTTTSTTKSTTTTISPEYDYEDAESLNFIPGVRSTNFSGSANPSARVKNSKIIILKNENFSQSENPEEEEFNSTEDKIISPRRIFSQNIFSNETSNEHFTDNDSSSSSFQYNNDTSGLEPVPETTPSTRISPEVRKTLTEAPGSLQKEFSQSVIKFVSGNVYSPGRHHEIVIDSPTPFDNFIFQIMGTEGNSGAYGDFIMLAPYTTAITCKGNMSRNTLMDTKDPIKFQVLNITWRGPPENDAPEKLNYRIKLVELPSTSKVIEGTLTKIDLPPHETSICGMRNYNVSNGATNRIVDVSCFRVCPADFPNCPFPQSNYALIIVKEEIDLIITMGAITTPYYNYIAFGKTEDMATLKNSDLHICYKNPGLVADIRLAFLFLLNRTTTPEQQEGDLTLNATFMDQETLWCRFRRPFIGSNVSVMDVNSPYYFFFFVGHYENGEFEIPDVNNMMMLDRRIKLEEEVFPADVLKLRRSGTWKIFPPKLFLYFLIFVSLKTFQ